MSEVLVEEGVLQLVEFTGTQTGAVVDYHVGDGVRLKLKLVQFPGSFVLDVDPLDPLVLGFGRECSIRLQLVEHVLVASCLDGLVLLHKISILGIEIFIIVTLICFQGIVVFFFFSFPITQISYVLIGWWLILHHKVILLVSLSVRHFLLGIYRFFATHLSFPGLLCH